MCNRIAAVLEKTDTENQYSFKTKLSISTFFHLRIFKKTILYAQRQRRQSQTQKMKTID